MIPEALPRGAAIMRPRSVAHSPPAAAVNFKAVTVGLSIIVIALLLFASNSLSPNGAPQTIIIVANSPAPSPNPTTVAKTSPAPSEPEQEPAKVERDDPYAEVVPSVAPSLAPAATLSALPSPVGVPDFSRQLTMLSTDLHISPIADLKDLIRRFFPSISVIDESLSGACGSMGTCAQRLQVLTPSNVEGNIYATKEIKHRFFDAYKEDGFTHDRLVLDADVIHCSHPTGMCEYYMPFNRSMIFWSTTRFEQGRERDAAHFSNYVTNVRAFASQPGNVILANSVYDQHYVHYFTGIMPQYVPSFCGYTKESYTWQSTDKMDAPAGRSPRSRTILIQGWRPSRARIAQLSLEWFLQPVVDALKSRGSQFGFLHQQDYYTRRYEYSELCEHPAIFHIPYQASVMSLFEQYRMGIPIIAPGPKMLTQWHMQYGMVSERTWEMVFHTRVPSGSIIGRHPDADEPFDPNDDTSPAAVEYWLSFADYYTFPHIITFESWDELAEKLTTLDLRQVSADMKRSSIELEAKLIGQWREIFDQIIPAKSRPSLEGRTYNERMDMIYGSDNWVDY